MEQYDPDDGIDSRFRVHDENQVELKLHYAIDPNARSTRYQVEAYLFVPATLGIDSHSYTREEFFSDVQAYIRFKTPVHALRSLAKDTPDSPLAKIRGALEHGREPLSRELRMLACLVRASVRDVAVGLQERVSRIGDLAEERDVLVRDLRDGVTRLCDDISAVLAGFRTLRPDFMHAQRPRWMNELFEYTDESMSVFAESYLTGLLKKIDSIDSLRDALGEVRASVTQVIVDEQEHRCAAGYVTVVRSGKPDGAYVHRRGMLKKFISSVLFLELSKARDHQRFAQLSAAVAAGAAMLVSTLLAIWSQEAYGMNTMPFVMALVVGYMLKDRMKDWIKQYFSTHANRWLADYTTTITDPLSNIVVGRCRESFTFLTEGRIPKEIWRCRHAHATSAVETEHKREAVMHYVKDIDLAGRRIDKEVARASDIADIVRLDVSRLTVRMDDPKQRFPVYDHHSDSIRTAKLPKHYHLNVVLVLRAGDRDVVQMQRVRFVLDKAGIQDLQYTDAEPTDAAVAVRAAVPRGAAPQRA